MSFWQNLTVILFYLIKFEYVISKNIYLVENETDFVLLHNVIDEETIKSNDWNSKDRLLNQK